MAGNYQKDLTTQKSAHILLHVQFANGSKSKKKILTQKHKKRAQKSKKNYEKMQIDVKAQKSKKNVTQVDDVN